MRVTFVCAAALLSAVCATGAGASADQGQAAGVVATGGAWQLTVLPPGPDGIDPAAAALCVQVTGDSREADVALEFTAFSAGAAIAAPVRTEGAVGRSQVIANLTAAGEGQVDLRVQLIVDGTRAGRPSVIVPAVTLRRGAARGVCAWETQR